MTGSWGGDLGLWWSFQWGGNLPSKGPLPPEQILRTSSEEGPLLGAAYSWTWEGEDGPSHHPSHRGMGGASSLSSQAASCFQLCGLHICVCTFVCTCACKLRCTNQYTTILVETPAGGLWFLPPLYPRTQPGEGTLQMLCQWGGNRQPWLVSQSSGNRAIDLCFHVGPISCLLPQCPAMLPSYHPIPSRELGPSSCGLCL